MHILCLNSGSSSIKIGLFHIHSGHARPLATGAIERLGQEHSRLWLNHNGHEQTEILGKTDHQTGLARLFALLSQQQLPNANAVVHRVVHGGAQFKQTLLITREIMAELEKLQRYAPLHMPANLLGIAAAREQLPGTAQIACFDTAFFHDLPRHSQQLALPQWLFEAGVRRYGFHGLSCQSVLRQLGQPQGKTIICHLGNGCSVTALDRGMPVDTTMGFTPTGGIMMGTRSGDIDPGVVVYLLREQHYDADQLEQLVNHHSGLLGISHTSADMQQLLQDEANAAPARLAVEMFVTQTSKQIGAYAAALGGLDLLVFTGGIGEHAWPIRARICASLAFFGITLDARANQDHHPVISTADSRIEVRVVATDENAVMAEQAWALLNSA